MRCKDTRYLFFYPVKISQVSSLIRYNKLGACSYILMAFLTKKFGTSNSVRKLSQSYEQYHTLVMQ